jgi:hypothetical protein
MISYPDGPHGRDPDTWIVQAFARLRDSVATMNMLTDFEFRFVCDLPVQYERKRWISWKQRKLARRILKERFGIE